MHKDVIVCKGSHFPSVMSKAYAQSGLFSTVLGVYQTI